MIQWGKIIFSTNGAGTTGYPHAKNENEPFPNTIHRINSNWVIGLHVIAKTIKLLEESIGVNLSDPELSNGFLNTALRAQPTKEKADKLDFSKLKTIVQQKNTIIVKIPR